MNSNAPQNGTTVATAPRPDGRHAHQLRPVQLTRRFTCHAEGSVLVAFGQTQVLCTASLEAKVPGFKKGSGEGWVTAEYGMLPRSTHTRSDREAARGKQSGRTQEIQRLIGRCLRAVVDLPALGEHTITLDCDVLQADGGTRTASVTGAWLALHDALAHAGLGRALKDQVAAVSVGVVGEAVLLDLNYIEDSGCETDLNLAMTGEGGFIEIQGTAEGRPFTPTQLQAMLEAGGAGLRQLMDLQRQLANDPSLLSVGLGA